MSSKKETLKELVILYFSDTPHIEELMDEGYAISKDDCIIKVKDNLSNEDMMHFVEIASGKYYHLWDKDYNYYGFETSEHTKYLKKKREIKEQANG